MKERLKSHEQSLTNHNRDKYNEMEKQYDYLNHIVRNSQ